RGGDAHDRPVRQLRVLDRGGDAGGPGERRRGRGGQRQRRRPDEGAGVSTTTAYDPILAQVIHRRLEVVCEEAAITLNRSSGSPIVTEANDFSTSLVSGDGDVIAFSSYLPPHFVSAMNAMRDILRSVDLSTVEPGDHFAANDPYTVAP